MSQYQISEIYPPHPLECFTTYPCWGRTGLRCHPTTTITCCPNKPLTNLYTAHTTQPVQVFWNPCQRAPTSGMECRFVVCSSLYGHPDILCLDILGIELFIARLLFPLALPQSMYVYVHTYSFIPTWQPHAYMLLFVAALYNYNVLYIALYTLAPSYTVRIYMTVLLFQPYLISTHTYTALLFVVLFVVLVVERSTIKVFVSYKTTSMAILCWL